VCRLCLCAIKHKKSLILFKKNVGLYTQNLILMSISDLFSSGFNKRNQDHFASMVRVAMSDGSINDEEKTFLDRLARNLDISKESYATILKDYETHPINPPTTQERRIERLYDLARMVHLDHIKNEDEVKILSKLAIGLGIDYHIVSKIVDKALVLVSEKADFDTFEEEVKKLFRIR